MNEPARDVAPRDAGPTTHLQPQSLPGRVARVLRLDRTVYPDLARDPAALGQAGWIVAGVAAAAALGVALASHWHAGAIAGAALAAVVRWLVWTALTVALARLFFRTRIHWSDLAAAYGYAQAPQFLAVVGFLPIVGPLLIIISRLWTLLAGMQEARAMVPLRSRQRIAVSATTFVLTLLLAALVEAWLGGVGFLAALVRP